MGLRDLVNDIGDHIEHAAESAEHGIGKTVDAGAHLLGDGLDKVGLHGAARTVDHAGDSVADHLGAEVQEAQLGESDDPKDLVHGDVDAINQAAEHLRKFAGAFGTTAQGLEGMDTQHWQGAAADAFRSKFHPQPKKWLDAREGCDTAARALAEHAQTVKWAQQQAQEAITLYRRGQEASAQARARYNQQVDAFNAAAASQPGGNPQVPHPGEFTDPGQAQQQQAKELLDRARQQRDSAAQQAASAITQATARAPQEPDFVSRMGAHASDIAEGGGVEAEHFLGGIAKGAGGIVKFARTLNPTDPYNLTHPAEFLDGVSSTTAGLVHGAVHPKELLSGLVGTGWGTDPAEAFGKLVPNIALAAATDGAGTAAGAGERAAVGIGENAAERGAAGVAENAAERETAGAGESAATRFSEDVHPPADPLHAAVNRDVDLASMPESPTWRESSEPLYRGDGRPPDEIFQNGFHPKDVSHTDLRDFVHTNRPSAFVSTSVDPAVYQQFPSNFRYVIEAPGGIDVNATLGDHLFAHEKEIAFPGGVDPRFIRGANPVVDSKGTLGEWIPNPGFNP